MHKILLVSACVLLFVPFAPATDLRGRVDGTHAYASAPFPLGGSHVTLFTIQHTPTGVNYVPMVSAVTGPDGIYYFNNIQPGSYGPQHGAVN